MRSRICSSVVVLPQPDSPTRPSVSPSRMSRSTPSTACTVPTRRLNTAPFISGNCLTRPVDPQHLVRSVARELLDGADVRDLGHGIDVGVPQVPAAISSLRMHAARCPHRADRGRASGSVGAGTRRSTIGQRGANGQPGGRLTSDGGLPSTGTSARLLGLVEPGDRAEQADRVRHPRPVVDVVDGARSRRRVPAYITWTRSAIPATTPRSWVIMMTAAPVSFCADLEDVEHLGLDRHVERGRRLVGDDHVGVVGDRHRDHHALAHAAGELVRERLDADLGVRDADQVEQLDRPLDAASLGQLLVDLERLDESGSRPCRSASARTAGPGRPSRSRCRGSSTLLGRCGRAAPRRAA